MARKAGIFKKGFSLLALLNKNNRPEFFITFVLPFISETVAKLSFPETGLKYYQLNQTHGQTARNIQQEGTREKKTPKETGKRTT
jgi:hypothetical protein